MPASEMALDNHCQLRPLPDVGRWTVDAVTAQIGSRQ
ncbi:hypothetical protein EES43_29840 [Streptomyces sp. ADI96-02]|nr:hypothetical protein EES43_29840 [Streptomyces sp. ADI96-02]